MPFYVRSEEDRSPYFAMQIKLVAKTKRNAVITLSGKLTGIDRANMRRLTGARNEWRYLYCTSSS